MTESQQMSLSLSMANGEKYISMFLLFQTTEEKGMYNRLQALIITKFCDRIPLESG